MAENSRIEWTDTTWNPIAGCSKVFAGCKHCYAEGMAKRLVAMGQAKYAGTVDEKGRWTGRVNFDEKALLAPLKWRKPRMVFVNSMSDLFHESVPFEFIDRVFAVMALCPSQTFQVLTKRPGRMLEYLTRPFPSLAPGLRGMAYKIHDCTIEIAREVGISKIADWDITPAFPTDQAWPMPNVWLGASVENQEHADARIPKLLACPAAVRFLSCEPLLGPVDVSRWLRVRWQCSFCNHYFRYYADSCPICEERNGFCGSHKFNGRKTPHTGLSTAQSGLAIDWVICGGESGPQARPMHPDWARGLRDQCQAADVPFFFKQWGEWAPIDEPFLLNPAEHGPCNKGYCGALSAFKRRHGAGRLVDLGQQSGWSPYDVKVGDSIRVGGFALGLLGKKKAGRHLDGREWNEVPEVAR